jgi:hypothetical protein
VSLNAACCALQFVGTSLRGPREIQAIIERLDRERMRCETDAFIAALTHDLISPADFARRATC